MPSASRRRCCRTKTSVGGIRPASTASRARRAPSSRGIAATGSGSGASAKRPTIRSGLSRRARDSCHRTVSHESVGREMLGCSKCVHPGVRSLWEFHQASDPRALPWVTTDVARRFAWRRSASSARRTRSGELVAGAREASISTHGGTLAVAAPPPPRQPSRRRSTKPLPKTCWISPNRQRPWPRTNVRVRHPPRSRPRFGVFVNASRAYRPFPRESRGLLLSGSAADHRPARAGAGRGHAIGGRRHPARGNVGGDSDSVASIAGGILGAMYPHTVNQGWVHVVEIVNQHHLTVIAGELASRRRARA